MAILACAGVRKKEDVGKVGVGIDAVHPAGFDDGVHAGGALAAGVGSTEKVVFSPKNNRGAILPISAVP
jgi:hypothetical protein